MKHLLIAILFFATTTGWSQVSVDPGRINFGTVTRESDRVVDILVENQTLQRDFLLRATFSHEFEVRYTSKTLEPGGSLVIRIQFNPREKGAFQENVQLYFASMQQPIVLPIRADVQYVNVNGNNPCPDFSQQAADCCSQNLFLVEVIDKDTREPIDRASVRIEEDGYIHLQLETNADGKVSREARIGFYSILAEKPGYKGASLTSYINKRNNRFVLELARDPDFVPEEELVIVPIPEGITRDTVLPADLYMPNNIVFLLDVSSSMASGNKLELMQDALRELTGIIRPIDQVALISYAGNARELLPMTRGDEKARIVAIIDALHANGTTSGARGFQRSYKELRKHLIADGNNQLIVITDGAFRPEDQAAIEKLVRKASRRNIRTSIVAIRSNDFAREKLRLVAELGNGSFLPIESPEDANASLVKEIKKQSRK